MDARRREVAQLSLLEASDYQLSTSFLQRMYCAIRSHPPICMQRALAIWL
jgi:hypothetical protein